MLVQRCTKERKILETSVTFFFKCFVFPLWHPKTLRLCRSVLLTVHYILDADTYNRLCMPCWSSKNVYTSIDWSLNNVFFWFVYWLIVITGTFSRSSNRPQSFLFPQFRLLYSIWTSSNSFVHFASFINSIFHSNPDFFSKGDVRQGKGISHISVSCLLEYSPFTFDYSIK